MMTDDNERETQAYLARIRKTIAESNRLVEQAGLRIRETDRMLEQQGLTREQVMAMHFTDAQIEAANAELKRRGLDPIEKWERDGLTEQEKFDLGRPPTAAEAPADNELAERQRKFGMMMKPFQI
jgi:hypothetical protein